MIYKNKKILGNGQHATHVVLGEDPSPETLTHPLPCLCPLGEPLFPLAAARLAPCA